MYINKYFLHFKHSFIPLRVLEEAVSFDKCIKVKFKSWKQRQPF